MPKIINKTVKAHSTISLELKKEKKKKQKNSVKQLSFKQKKKKKTRVLAGGGEVEWQVARIQSSAQHRNSEWKFPVSKMKN